MSTQVLKSDLIAWKNDKVTQLIFSDLKVAKEVCLERMVSSENLDNPNGLLYLNRLRGYIDAIEEILNLNPSELVETEEE